MSTRFATRGAALLAAAALLLTLVTGCKPVTGTGTSGSTTGSGTSTSAKWAAASNTVTPKVALQPLATALIKHHRATSKAGAWSQIASFDSLNEVLTMQGKLKPWIYLKNPDVIIYTPEGQKLDGSTTTVPLMVYATKDFTVGAKITDFQLSQVAGYIKAIKNGGYGPGDGVTLGPKDSGSTLVDGFAA